MSFIEIEYKERDGAWSMSELQSHDYFELYFLLSGKREFFFKNKMFNIYEGTLAIIPPFAMHKTAGGAYKRINVNISKDYLNEQELAYLGKLSDSGVYRLSQDCFRLASELLTAASEINSVDPDVEREMLLSFAHTVLYFLMKNPPKPLECEATTETNEDSDMLKVAAFINKRYAEELSLENIADSFYISKNSLCARFKRAMNCSVMQYLSFVRLSRAKELLSTTGMSIEEISGLSGYSSANYFSLIFKRNVGISPSEYRKTK